MKKYSLLMGLMCAALSITSCSKDNTETFDKPKGYEFELYAAPQTRTEVDGLDMKWSADDAMNVFHAPTGTTNYSSNDQFTLAEIESGRFTGLITDTEFDPNGTYDWYAVYPYSKYMASPAESNSGSYFTVGSEAGSAQQQTGIDNQAHISGESIPLYGTATGVTGSPNLQMHHITTLFRINVTNTGSADLNVTSISLTSASENLIGTYYFDITGAAPVLTSSGDNYVSKTAALNVTDGIVAPDATGSFYLATRAFTAPEGEQLTLKVTANGETVEKVATLSKETTFAAGKINKLNINVAAAAEQASTWEKVTSLADITAGEYIIANGDYFLPTTTTGGSNAPVPYTLESQGISFVADSFTGIVPDIAKWTFTGTNTAMTITNSGGDYLYGINANNGIRVGTTSDITWAFEVYNDGFAMKNSNDRYCAIYVNDSNEPQDWRSYTSKNHSNYQINDGILYLYKKGVARPALETPTGVEAVAEGNEVLVGWNEVSGAASYTVSFEPATIEPQTIESTGEASYAESFTLDYATEYTVSVVANPADTENYKASAPATATFTTGESPNHQVYTMVGDDANLGEGQYIFAALNGTEYLAATSLEESKTYGYLPFAAVMVNENQIASNTTNDAYAFTLEASDTPGQYYLKDTYGRYMYNSGSYNSFNVASSKDTDNTYLWTISMESDGTVSLKNVASGKWMQRDASYGTFGIYDTEKGARPYAFKLNDGSLVPPTPKPILAVSSENVAFAAAGESKEVTYTAENLGSNQVFAAVSGENASQFSATVGNGTVTVTAAENTETTAKTATLTLYIAASEGGEHLAEATVALTQAGVPSGEAAYVKVTTTPDSWEGEYLIVYESSSTSAYAFDGSLAKLDVTNNYRELNISNNSIPVSSETEAIKFTIEATDGGYNIKAANGQYIYQSSDANGLVVENTPGAINTISLESNGAANIVASKAHLRFNAASDQMRFRYYKSSSYTRQKEIFLYKLNN